MAYYDALISKWGTLSGSTQQKLAAINALTVPAPNAPVPIAQVMSYLRENGLWLPIKAAAAAGTSQGAMAALDLNQDLRQTSIDFSLPLVGAMLADLVSHGLLTSGQSAALTAMGTPPVLWWQAPVAQGGGGLSSSVSQDDLTAAGLS
jgi:hypothetical protein